MTHETNQVHGSFCLRDPFWNDPCANTLTTTTTTVDAAVRTRLVGVVDVGSG